MANTALIMLLFITIRIVSYATYQQELANQITAALCVVLFTYICNKNLKLGWVILVSELLLGGVGHFFEFNGLILRTWFLGIFIIGWIIKELYRSSVLDSRLRGNDILLCFRLTDKKTMYSLISLLVIVIWSAVNGYYSGHARISILQDAVMYFFILLLFPALEFREYTKKIMPPIAKAWIIGSTIFSAIVFFIYSAGFCRLPDTFYHWFRNIAAGKITDLGNNFFRIVLPEHLFIVPVILILTAFLLREPKSKKLWALTACSVLIITLNFSRIYWLGLFVGLIFLGFRHSLKRWLALSAIVLASIPILFSTLHFASSRGESLGLELLGLRMAGASQMKSDPSGAIRLAILPDAMRQIKSKPWFGSGIGATVTYMDPATREQVTRTQFDWGYLEMLVELGIIGTAVFLIFFLAVFYNTAKAGYSRIMPEISEAPLLRGLCAGAIALCVMNITTPAIFHGFGMLYLAGMIVVVRNKEKGVRNN